MASGGSSRQWVFFGEPSQDARAVVDLVRRVFEGPPGAPTAISRVSPVASSSQIASGAPVGLSAVKSR
ncbi:hypothetical protein BCY76_010065 [Nesterenkonia sp. PF2B19]|nr:hypothetical protein BCY76_010065 [Nesterenkonia sp. PF2B19]